MLPVKRESHLHYQGKSCKGKYFALHWERQALERWDLESNLGPWSLVLRPWSLALGPWSLVLGPWPLVLGPWPLVLGPWSLVLGRWLQASGFGGGRARCLGATREKQVPF